MEFIIILLIILSIYLISSIRIVPEYERLVVFFLGKYQGISGPGLVFIFTPFQASQRVSLRIQNMNISSQEIVTKDSVTLKIAAACFWRIKDPAKAVLKIQNYNYAVEQISQTSLRGTLSQNNLDSILSKQRDLALTLKEIIDSKTEEWGIEIETVELKDIELPDNLKRALAREAEAERERRAKVISAQGENEAASLLVSAAGKMSTEPMAFQLRWLETLLAIAGENNSVIIPVPVDMLNSVLGKKT